ncbi:MAG TPA: aminotransferase class V-fold PLP-dependent enzyme [Gemmatimonadales bacterium]|jgi:aspartate aminotransferase-like enzyme|nr:aminotransferase class V-fold PLP-dependent enzyme [Gemmatimonadales bacterium]
MSPFGRNFLPGPTDIRAEVLAALQQPLFSHRSPRMRTMLAEMQPALQECFGTRQPVFVATCSGTGLLEAAIRSGVRERVLVAVGGYFGEYFARVAESCGKQALRVEVHPGTAITPEQLEQFLEGPSVDAVAVVHSESSTGALADIPALARVVRARQDLLLLVDGVSSVGAMPIEMDRWGVDYYCTGSQKALALPPGLALGAASERFLARAESQEDAGFYLSVKKLVSIARDNLPFWTPAMSLFLALECQLKRIGQAGGWPARWARHRAMLELLERWVAARPGVRLLAREGARSPAISALVLPGGRRAAEVIDALELLGFLVGAPLDRRQGSVLRIGHMGDLEPQHLATLLDHLSELIA